MVKFHPEGPVMMSVQENTYYSDDLNDSHHHNEKQQHYFVTPVFSDRFDNPFDNSKSKRVNMSKDGNETPSTVSGTGSSFSSSVSNDTIVPIISSKAVHNSHISSLISKREQSFDIDMLPSTPLHGPVLMKTYDISSSSISTSSFDEPVVLQRSSGSRPFDEKSHDLKVIGRVEESRSEEAGEPLNIDEAPLLGEEIFLEKSDDDPIFDLAFGGTWEVPISLIQAFTLNTQNSTCILPPRPARAPDCPALILPRETHDISLSNNGINSIDEPVVLERSSGSLPFDEKLHDLKEPSCVEESRLEAHEPLDIDVAPLLGEELFRKKSDDESMFDLVFGDTLEASNSSIQVFQDEDTDSSSVFQSFKDNNMHQLQQLQQQQPKLMNSQRQRLPQKEQQMQTAAQRRRSRRARRYQSQYPRNMVSSDDSLIESDHTLKSLQIRAKHAHLRRNHGKTSTQIPVDDSDISVAGKEKPIRSAMINSIQLSSQLSRASKRSLFVSFDENPDTVHHYISDQVHTTFSDDEDDDYSRNKEYIRSKVGVTEMLQDLFYFVELPIRDSVRKKEASNNVEDDSTLGNLKMKLKQSNFDDSSTNNSGNSGRRGIQAVKKEAANNGNETDCGKSPLTAIWGAVEGGVEVFTKAIVPNDHCSPSCGTLCGSMDMQVMISYT